MWHSVQGRMVGGTKVPFQVAEIQLETLKQSAGKNKCGFYVIWAILRYPSGRSEKADALVCIFPISFISVNSTKRYVVFSYICIFRYYLFWTIAQRNFTNPRLTEIEILALSSELAPFILSEVLEKGVFSIAQSVKYKEQYGPERIARIL
jgi:hypothetical protein